MNLKKSTIIICIVWALIILTGIIKNEIILHNGREVLLKTVPVDPRDLLMGDYVILNYEVGQVPSYYEYKPNSEVYTILKTDKNNIAKIDEISYKKPSSKLFLKGKFTECDTVIPFWKNGHCIKYGIESYYVKEHTGRKLEKDLQDGALVNVVIDKNGNAKVKGFVDKLEIDKK